MTHLYSDKIDFKVRLMRGDQEGHFILIKERIHQDDIITINICVPNSGTPNFIFKENVLLDIMIQNDRKLWIEVDFNDPLSLNATSYGQKLSRKTTELSNILCQMYSTLFYTST